MLFRSYLILKNLIINYDERVKIASLGRIYAERYLRPKYFCHLIVNNLFNNKSIEPLYYPEFFRKHYIPEDDFLDIYNNWTNVVKNEPWYKEYIQSGTRQGLQF